VAATVWKGLLTFGLSISVRLHRAGRAEKAASGNYTEPRHWYRRSPKPEIPAALTNL